MILGKIGENRSGEVQACGAVQFQGMGRNLHDHILHAFVHHLGEEALQVQGLRGGPFRLHSLAAQQDLDGANQPHLIAGLLQNGFHEIGCGGLAVGARHPHNPQFAGWVLVEVGRGNPQGIAGIVHHNLSQVEVGNRPFHQNASGAPFPGLMDKIVAIELLPHHGHEEISRFYPARIIADAAKARCFSVYLVFQSVQYRIQLHWPSPSTKAQTALPPMNLWEPASRRWAPAARLLRCPPL